MRYLAEQLFVCLLEVLARFRANDAADAVLEQMTPGLDHPLLADLVDPEQVAGIDAFLTANQVAVFTAPSSAPPESLVDVFDPDLLAALDEHHRVREQLRRPEVVEAYGQNGTVHLEGSLIRNASTKVGRPVTQEIGWLLLDVMHVQGLRYYSRHAEGEEAICWAMNGDAPLRIGPVRALDPGDEEHRTAVQRVAARYRLSLPQHWAPGPSATFSSAYEAAVQ